MNDKSEEDPNFWMSDIRTQFPDWKTQSSLQRWPEVKNQLPVGQTVSGQTIARAPFGVWLDIGVSFPALLLVHNMKDAHVQTPIGLEDYPALDASVDGRINALGDAGEIGITQLSPDTMIESDNAT